MQLLAKRDPKSSAPTSRLVVVTFSAVLLFLSACGLMYWQFVSSQTLYLEERNFRALATSSHALAQMIANYEKVFTSIVEGQPVESDKNPLPNKDRLNCLRNPPTKLSPKLKTQHYFEGALCAIPDLRNVTLEKHSGNKVIKGMIVKFERDGTAPRIKLEYTHKLSWKIEAELDITHVFQKLMTEEIFSDLLLTDQRGHVFSHKRSQRDASGLEFTDIASIFEEPQQPDQKEKTQKGFHARARTDLLIAKLPLVKDMKLGDMRYKVFAQPGILAGQEFSAETESDKKERNGEYILAGIIPAGKFEIEAQAISTNHLLLLIGIILAIFFSLPHIKLRSTQSTDRLSSSQVAILIFFSLMGTGLITLVIFDLLAYQKLQDEFDNQLEYTAQRIQSNFHEDLEEARKQLSDLDQSSLNGPLKKDERIQDNFRKFTMQNRFSPDVNEMLWITPDGRIKALLSREEAPWKTVRLDERTYVQRIWNKTAFKSETSPFWIEPIYSWTSGENYTIVSKESVYKESTVQSSSGAAELSQRPVVAALEVKLPSVMDPVIPPGFGFAIVDQSGLVMFHSDSRRNLRENLFKETDQNVRLRAAVFARTSDRFDGKYWGRDRSFFVSAIPDVQRHDAHWSLVSYWDTDMLRITNLQALFFGGSLFAIYSIIVLGIGVVGFLIYPTLKKRRSDWMWPQPQRQRHYELVCLLNLSSLVLIGVWSLKPEPSLGMFLWTLCLPLLALAATKILLQSPVTPGSSLKGLSPLDHRQSYVLMVGTILMANAMAPAFGFLKLALDSEIMTLAKFSQYDLLLDIEERKQRINHFYRNVASRSPEFIKARLGEEGDRGDRRDIYANFPFKVSNLDLTPSSESHTEQNSSLYNSDPLRRLFDSYSSPIRKLHSIFRVHFNTHGELDTEGFIEAGAQWRFLVKDGPQTKITLQTGSKASVTSILPETVPNWLYWGLVCSGPVLFGYYSLFKMHVKLTSKRKMAKLIALVACLAILIWLAYPESILFVLTIAVGLGLYYLSVYSVPGFVARRVFFLDFAYPLFSSNQHQSNVRTMYARAVVRQLPSLGQKGRRDLRRDLRRFFFLETCQAEPLRKIGEKLLNDKSKIETIRKADDYEVAKEQIIREVSEAAEQFYKDLWTPCSASERIAMFHLAKDGFLHARNPDIRPLLKKELISLSPDLRLMNESFRRFVIGVGERQNLNNLEIEESASTWTQVWRPMGVGVALIAVFLIFTQEQYRQVTVAFLGALPVLLGTFSQLLNTTKKDKLGGPPIS